MEVITTCLKYREPFSVTFVAFYLNSCNFPSHINSSIVWCTKANLLALSGYRGLEHTIKTEQFNQTTCLNASTLIQHNDRQYTQIDLLRSILLCQRQLRDHKAILHNKKDIIMHTISSV